MGQLITRDNFGPLLKRSTQGRAGTPDGNIFVDTANDLIEIITEEELATVDFGGGAVANPLTNEDKIQGLAIYFFLLQEVESDVELQKFLAAMDAAPNRLGKLTGATSFLSGIKLATAGSLGDDRLKLASTGFTEFAAGSGGSTLIDRVYHGAKSLSNIFPTSQPFYQLAASLGEADRQAAIPVDFSKTGDIDEVIQSFGSTANGDAGAGNDDNRNAVLILGVREFGNTIGETNSTATGVAELGAYSQGYGLGEGVAAELVGINPADVWGGSQVAPYDGLSFERVAVAETKTGFTTADGDYTDIIRNTGGATLLQMRAWADIFMQQDTDQNALTGSTGAFIPKRAEPIYTINSQGKMVTRQSVFFEGVPTSDQQSIVQTDNAGTAKVYPFNPSLIFKLSAAWFNDPKPWFRAMFQDGALAADFDTTGAVTIEDSDALAVAGDNTDARIVSINSGEYYELQIAYPYDSDVLAGLNAGEDKAGVFQCGGTETSKRRTVLFELKRTATIPVDATTEAETN